MMTDDHEGRLTELTEANAESRANGNHESCNVLGYLLYTVYYSVQ